MKSVFAMGVVGMGVITVVPTVNVLARSGFASTGACIRLHLVYFGVVEVVIWKFICPVPLCPLISGNGGSDVHYCAPVRNAHDVFQRQLCSLRGGQFGIVECLAWGQLMEQFIHQLEGLHDVEREPVVAFVVLAHHGTYRL